MKEQNYDCIIVFKGHNYDHGKKDICKKCGKIHKHPSLGMKFPKDEYPNRGWQSYHTKFKKENPEEYHKQRVRSGIKSAEANKKSNVGLFSPNHWIQILGSKTGGKMGGPIGGIKAAETNKKNKTSAFFDKRIQKLGGKMQTKKYGGWYWKNEVLKKTDPQKYFKDCSKAGKLGGIIACEINRKNKPYWFLGVPFDSNLEIKAFKLFLLKLQQVPEERENCQIQINGSSIDGRLWNTIFWEYHPWDRNLTLKQYYKKRRKILDENGFKDYPLVIFKSLEEVEMFIKSFNEEILYDF